jgi:sulfite exporter TauE/SafE
MGVSSKLYQYVTDRYDRFVTLIIMYQFLYSIQGDRYEMSLKEKVTVKLYNWYAGLYPKSQLRVAKILFVFGTILGLMVTPFLLPYYTYAIGKYSFWAGIKFMVSELRGLPHDVKMIWETELADLKASAKKDNKLWRTLK